MLHRALRDVGLPTLADPLGSTSASFKASG